MVTILKEILQPMLQPIFFTEETPGPVTWGPYASLAAAEASGDTWANTDIITITGGPDFKYFTVLDENGHSGLIHRYPFNDSFEVTDGTLGQSTVAAEDPDNWGVNWTDEGVGTKTTDYDNTSTASRSLMRSITTSGKAQMKETTQPPVSKTKAFLIMDNVRTHAYSGTSWLSEIRHTIDDGTDISCQLFRTSTNFSPSTTWWVMTDWFATFVDTGIPYATERRMWCYFDHDNTKQSIWSDDDATPAYNSTSMPFQAASSWTFSVQLSTVQTGLATSGIGMSYLAFGGFDGA